MRSLAGSEGPILARENDPIGRDLCFSSILRSVLAFLCASASGGDQCVLDESIALVAGIARRAEDGDALPAGFQLQVEDRPTRPSNPSRPSPLRGKRS